MLTECALPGWMSRCDGAINTAQSFINATLPSRLATLYSGIRSRAPHAKVVVVGYPRIFNGEDCNALTWWRASSPPTSPPPGPAAPRAGPASTSTASSPAATAEPRRGSGPVDPPVQPSVAVGRQES
ncbi:hypothetical protein AAII07_00380 [Microvirga sp. 0TCS3.31]